MWAPSHWAVPTQARLRAGAMLIPVVASGCQCEGRSRGFRPGSRIDSDFDILDFHAHPGELLIFTRAIARTGTPSSLVRPRCCLSIGAIAAPRSGCPDRKSVV